MLAVGQGWSGHAGVCFSNLTMAAEMLQPLRRGDLPGTEVDLIAGLKLILTYLKYALISRYLFLMGTVIHSL